MQPQFDLHHFKTPGRMISNFNKSLQYGLQMAALEYVQLSTFIAKQKSCESKHNAMLLKQFVVEAYQKHSADLVTTHWADHLWANNPENLAFPFKLTQQKTLFSWKTSPRHKTPPRRKNNCLNA